MTKRTKSGRHAKKTGRPKGEVKGFKGSKKPKPSWKRTEDSRKNDRKYHNIDALTRNFRVTHFGLPVALHIEVGKMIPLEVDGRDNAQKLDYDVVGFELSYEDKDVIGSSRAELVNALKQLWERGSMSIILWGGRYLDPLIDLRKLAFEVVGAADTKIKPSTSDEQLKIVARLVKRKKTVRTLKILSLENWVGLKLDLEDILKNSGVNECIQE